MTIIISNHAIEQYKKRMFDFDKGDKEVSSILREIARKGEVICLRPTVTKKTVYELKYHDLSIVAEVHKGKVTVITFLGDSLYRRWAKKDIALRYTQKAVG